MKRNERRDARLAVSWNRECEFPSSTMTRSLRKDRGQGETTLEKEHGKIIVHLSLQKTTPIRFSSQLLTPGAFRKLRFQATEPPFDLVARAWEYIPRIASSQNRSLRHDSRYLVSVLFSTKRTLACLKT